MKFQKEKFNIFLKYLLKKNFRLDPNSMRHVLNLACKFPETYPDAERCLGPAAFWWREVWQHGHWHGNASAWHPSEWKKTRPDSFTAAWFAAMKLRPQALGKWLIKHPAQAKHWMDYFYGFSMQYSYNKSFWDFLIQHAKGDLWTLAMRHGWKHSPEKVEQATLLWKDLFSKRNSTISHDGPDVNIGKAVLDFFLTCPKPVHELAEIWGNGPMLLALAGPEKCMDALHLNADGFRQWMNQQTDANVWNQAWITGWLWHHGLHNWEPKRGDIAYLRSWMFPFLKDKTLDMLAAEHPMALLQYPRIISNNWQWTWEQFKTSELAASVCHPFKSKLYLYLSVENHEESDFLAYFEKKINRKTAEKLWGLMRFKAECGP